LFFTAVSQWWSGNLFVVASGIYLGTAALGALRLGQSLFGVLNVLLQTFENYILPQTALKIQQSQSIGISYLKEMNQKLAYVFIPVLLLVFIFSSFLITLAGGKDFTEYAFVLKGLSILYIFILLSQPIRFYFRSMQMNSHFFYAYFISLVFALSTSHWLISAYGLQGAIAGLIGSQILLLTYWSIILQLKNINIWKSSTSY
jgi:O-antigen/teichoic acid export membrane protein